MAKLEETEDSAKVVNKASARDAIFAKKHTSIKKEHIIFNGVQLELRQPSVSQFMESQSGDDRAFMVKFLIEYSYIAGTNEKPFEESDYDALVNMPFNASWTEVTRAIQNLVDIKVEDKVKN